MRLLTRGVDEITLPLDMLKASDSLLCAQVITISGRTIKDEAQESPVRAEACIAAIDSLIAALPADLVAGAKDFRARRAAAVAAA